MAEGQQPSTGGEISITISTPDAPSNRLAMALEMAAFGVDARMVFNYEAITEPDPRQPVMPIAYPIWRFDGTHAFPALSAPAAAVVQAIAQLAQMPYDHYANWAQASHVAHRLGVACVQEILAVMVHPPALPADMSALVWLPRVQLAAAEVIGQLDDGWQDSVRRKALLSLLHGPQDWATCAAIRVLGRIARFERAYAEDIHECFALQEKALPVAGYWDWIEVLYSEWLTNPCLFDDEREQLEAKQAALAE